MQGFVNDQRHFIIYFSIIHKVNRCFTIVYIGRANFTLQGADGLQGSPGTEGPEGLQVSAHGHFFLC